MICHNHGKPICCSIFQRIKSCDSIIAGNHKACLFLQRFIDNSPIDSIALPNPVRCLYGYLRPQTLQSFMENPPREYAVHIKVRRNHDRFPLPYHRENFLRCLLYIFHLPGIMQVRFSSVKKSLDLFFCFHSAIHHQANDQWVKMKLLRKAIEIGPPVPYYPFPWFTSSLSLFPAAVHIACPAAGNSSIIKRIPLKCKQMSVISTKLYS